MPGAPFVVASSCDVHSNATEWRLFGFVLVFPKAVLGVEALQQQLRKGAQLLNASVRNTAISRRNTAKHEAGEAGFTLAVILKTNGPTVSRRPSGPR